METFFEGLQIASMDLIEGSEFIGDADGKAVFNNWILEFGWIEFHSSSRISTVWNFEPGSDKFEQMVAISSL